MEKQSRFFCGEKKELLQLLCIFPNHTICNSYSEICPYFPCLYFGEQFKESFYHNTVLFIVASKRINNTFIYVNEAKLKDILCDFYGCEIPSIKSNEPLLSLIYKYSICKKDVVCSIPIATDSTIFAITNHLNNINEDNKFLWNIFIKRMKYSFLKTGNQTLHNYIALLRKIL